MSEELETKPENITESSAPGMLHLACAPHLRQRDSVRHIMVWVLIALLPSVVAGGVFFGVRPLLLIAVSVITAVLTEWSIGRLTGRITAVGDGSAMVTGVLLALSVSPALPWWMVAIGAAFAIGVVKMAFGGCGTNFVNPALAGRAFLMASYPAAMTGFVPTGWGNSFSGIDGISAATPLAHFKSAMANGSFQPLDFQDALYNLFIGNVGGCAGGASALAVLIGGVLLLYKRIIPLRIPLVYIGTVFFLNWLFNGTGSHFTSGAIIVPFYQVLAGGLMLGAFFMATDPVTTPITPVGRIIFAAGCGVLTFIIRKFGAYPDGVSYAILIMNLFVALIERYTRPRAFGAMRHHA